MQIRASRLAILASGVMMIVLSTGFRKQSRVIAPSEGISVSQAGIQWDYPVEGIIQSNIPCQNSGLYAAVFRASARDDQATSLPISATVKGDSSGICSVRAIPGSDFFIFEGPAGIWELALKTAADSEVVFPVTINSRMLTGNIESCEDTIHVALGEHCQAKALYNFVANSPADCTLPSDFRVLVNDENLSNQDTVDGSGWWTFLIQFAIEWDGLLGPLDKERLLVTSDDRSSFFLTSDAKVATLALKPGNSYAKHLWSARFTQTGTLSMDWNLTGRASVKAALLHPDGSMDTLAIVSNTEKESLSGVFAEGDRLMVLTALEANEDIPSPFVRWSNVHVAYTGDSPINRNEIICKGVIRAEDLSPPLVECPVDLVREGTRRDSWQAITGVFSADSNVLPSLAGDCFPAYEYHPGKRYWESYTLRPLASGNYDLSLYSELDQGHAGMALYLESFDLDYPCRNILGQRIDSDKSPAVLRFWLEAGQTYTLLVLTDVPLAKGGFKLEIRQDSGTFLPDLPVFEGQQRLPLYCGDLSDVLQQRSSFELVAMPAFSDNCSIADTSFKDVVLSETDCGETLLRRTFKVRDFAGNFATCSYDIRFSLPSLSDLVLPPKTFTIDCGATVPENTAGLVAPSWSGYPMLETLKGPVLIEPAYCNLSAAYKDGSKLEHCGGAFSFLRNWTLIDWCRPSTSFSYTQVLKIGDFSAPSFVSVPGIEDTLTFSAANNDCSTSFLLPLPRVVDACSDWQMYVEILAYVDPTNTNVLLQGEASTMDTLVLMRFLGVSERKFVGGLSPGNYTIKYTLTDACGNISMQLLPLRVVDKEAPVAVCVDQLTIGINNSGTAVLFAKDVDEGSLDHCSPVKIGVRRSPDESWSEAVYFDCEDIGDTVAVFLQVTDAEGNASTCEAAVLVEDKGVPECFAPRSVSVSSLDLPPSFVATDTLALQDLFGMPSGADNCAYHWREKMPLSELDACGNGLIRRQFEVFDKFGNKNKGLCEQLIEIIPGHNYAIKFPRDASYDCSSPQMADSIALVDYKQCDLLSVYSQDKYSYSEDQQCYLIFRTFEVINWCEFDGLGNPYVLSRDEDCDGLNGEEDVWVVRKPDHIFTDRDADPFNGIPAVAEKKAACYAQGDKGYWQVLNDQAVTGYWSYTQIIEVSDNHAPEISFLPPAPVCVFNGSDCMTEIDYLVLILDNCNPQGLDVEVAFDAYADGFIDRVLPLLDSTGVGIVSGEYPKYRIRDRMPVGRHSYRITARDACGNSSQRSLTFDVIDCEAPYLACIGALATELSYSPGGTDKNGDGKQDRAVSLIRVEDVLAGSGIDCTDIHHYSLNKAGEKPDPGATTVLLTCDDMPAVTLELYAWDNAFNPAMPQPDGTMGGPNYSVCETVVFVQDNLNNFCDAFGIKGNIARENGEPLPGVRVSLNGNLGGVTESDASGNYGFQSLSPLYDYTILPVHDSDPVHGVTTFDVLKIADHILGVNKLSSSYQLIAADADNSGAVTALDLIVLRRLILRKIAELPNNTSWRFVDAAYTFSNPEAPWRENYPELINISSRSNPERTEFDFVAIKVGDVAEGISSPAYNTDREAKLYLEPFGDLFAESGLSVYMDFDLPLKGMQFSLAVENQAKHELQVIPRSLFPDEVYWDQESGAIQVSVVRSEMVPTKEPLFTIFSAGEEELLPSSFRLNEVGINGEVYSTSGHIYPLGISVFPGSRQEWLNAYPNPFRDQLHIPVVLEKAGPVSIELYAQNGQFLFRKEYQLMAGSQEILLQDVLFHEDGSLFFLRIKANGHQYMQKILHLKP